MGSILTVYWNRFSSPYGSSDDPEKGLLPRPSLYLGPSGGDMSERGVFA
jgi:hypothetical protein